MRSSIVRSVIAPLALTAVALIAGRAHADIGTAPPASCQSNSPHHTATLGAGVDSATVTSTLPYWDNACGCYIAQFEVPAASSPEHGGKLQKSFHFNQTSIWQALDKNECGSWHEDVFVYKKDRTSGEWKPVGNKSTATGHYASSENICLVSSIDTGTFNPPADGTDSYRVLKRFEFKGKFRPVVVTASHTPNPGPPLH